MKATGCKNCPLYEKGKGFVLGSGDPSTCRFAVLLEAPGRTELETSPDAVEARRREVDYPDIPVRSRNTGVPAVGQAGLVLDGWILRSLSIARKDIFIDNTLRCLPPKSPNGSFYPTGDERKEAEVYCRQYDRWDRFGATVAIVTLHPASLLRDPVPLPLVLADYRKALDFTEAGERVVMLAGQKAAEWWLGRTGINVQKWRGHYEFERPELKKVRGERLV